MNQPGAPQPNRQAPVTREHREKARSALENLIRQVPSQRTVEDPGILAQQVEEKIFEQTTNQDGYFRLLAKKCVFLKGRMPQNGMHPNAGNMQRPPMHPNAPNGMGMQQQPQQPQQPPPQQQPQQPQPPQQRAGYPPQGYQVRGQSTHPGQQPTANGGMMSRGPGVTQEYQAKLLEMRNKYYTPLYRISQHYESSSSFNNNNPKLQKLKTQINHFLRALIAREPHYQNLEMLNKIEPLIHTLTSRFAVRPNTNVPMNQQPNAPNQGGPMPPGRPPAQNPTMANPNANPTRPTAPMMNRTQTPTPAQAAVLAQRRQGVSVVPSSGDIRTLSQGNRVTPGAATLSSGTAPSGPITTPVKPTAPAVASNAPVPPKAPIRPPVRKPSGTSTTIGAGVVKKEPDNKKTGRSNVKALLDKFCERICAPPEQSGHLIQISKKMLQIFEKGTQGVTQHASSSGVLVEEGKAKEEEDSPWWLVSLELLHETNPAPEQPLKLGTKRPGDSLCLESSEAAHWSWMNRAPSPKRRKIKEEDSNQILATVVKKEEPDASEEAESKYAAHLGAASNSVEMVEGQDWSSTLVRDPGLPYLPLLGTHIEMADINASKVTLPGHLNNQVALYHALRKREQQISEELRHLEPEYEHFEFHLEKDTLQLRIMCYLAHEAGLLPPLKIQVPVEYPSSPVEYSFHPQYDTVPFLNEIRKAFEKRLLLAFESSTFRNFATRFKESVQELSALK